MFGVKNAVGAKAPHSTTFQSSMLIALHYNPYHTENIQASCALLISGMSLLDSGAFQVRHHDHHTALVDGRDGDPIETGR
jgi:hypothetical protein